MLDNRTELKADPVIELNKNSKLISTIVTEKPILNFPSKGKKDGFLKMVVE